MEYEYKTINVQGLLNHRPGGWGYSVLMYDQPTSAELDAEINKHAHEGWEVVTISKQADSGWFLHKGDGHATVVMKRIKS
jgi:hypothetical protein